MSVEAIKNGQLNKAAIFRNGRHELIDLFEAIEAKREYDPKMYEITKIMAI
jgi:hypothetical protein